MIKKHNKLPFFSVIIPAYNVAEWIQETLTSVYNQTYDDLEIIVVNDGSTDDTLSILLSQVDKRLVVIDQPNKGVSAARNIGIAAAKGKYIAFLDGDDVWEPFHLILAVAFFSKNEDIKWFSPMHLECKEIPPLSSLPDIFNIKMYIYDYFLLPLYMINSSSIIMERNSIPCDFFPVNIAFSEDRNTWFRFALTHERIGICHIISSCYRICRNESAVTSLNGNILEIMRLEYSRFAHMYQLWEQFGRPATAYSYLRISGVALSCNLITSLFSRHIWRTHIRKLKPFIPFPLNEWLVILGYVFLIVNRIIVFPLKCFYKFQILIRWNKCVRKKSSIDLQIIAK